MTNEPHNRNPLGDLLNALMAEADCDPERALELACRRLGDGSLHRLASEHDLVMEALRAACVEIVAANGLDPLVVCDHACWLPGEVEHPENWCRHTVPHKPFGGCETVRRCCFGGDVKCIAHNVKDEARL